VLSLDEKGQIQALDRTQPGLTIKPGRCQTMTHDYKALLDSGQLAILSRSMPRPRKLNSWAAISESYQGLGMI